MKKLVLILAAVLSVAATGLAQDREIDLNQFEISKKGSKVETKLHVGFPMQFGWSVLTNVTYKGAWNNLLSFGDVNLPAYLNFLDMKTGQNFMYSLETAALHFSKPGGLLDFSIGMRCTFMDFSLQNTQYTFRPMGGSGIYHLYTIKNEALNYDGRKSKIHANYIGVPVRLTFNFGKAKLFAGASAEVLVGGYTKYKFPKYRQDAAPLFNRFRATVEGGLQYGILGFFVSYGLTPLFPDSLSDARALTFGIVLGS